MACAFSYLIKVFLLVSTPAEGSRPPRSQRSPQDEKVSLHAEHRHIGSNAEPALLGSVDPDHSANIADFLKADDGVPKGTLLGLKKYPEGDVMLVKQSGQGNFILP